MNLPHLKARIRQHPDTKFWHAVFYAWDAKADRWRRCLKSTKTTNKVKAAGIAQELQSFALRAQGADTTITREHVLDTLNHILRLSGRQPVAESQPWDKYSQAWLDLARPRTAGRTLQVYEGYVRSLNRWLADRSGTSIIQITANDLQGWYNSLIAEGRKPATANCSLQAISTIFKRARAEGFCQRNPADLVVRQNEVADVRSPFSAREISTLLSHLRSTENTEWLTVTLLGICTGQRLQDCSKAAWDQIEETAGAMVWRLQQRKTGTIVTVPIVDPLASHLAKMQPVHRSGPLAPGLAKLASAKLSVQFAAILQRLDIDRTTRRRAAGTKGHSWTDKTFHSLRHTTNSLLANAGISDDVRRKILGHASTKMNDRYTHLEITTTLNALAQALSGLS
jgi:integrase